MKKFTKRWIEKRGPCQEAVEWFYAQKEREVIPVLRKLIASKKYEWANWAIVRCMRRKSYLKYAIYAAELVLDLYEKEYPSDKRPREAINAAKKCIEKPITENKNAARSAASAAWSAEIAAKVKTQIKILRYGLKLLEEEKKKGNENG